MKISRIKDFVKTRKKQSIIVICICFAFVIAIVLGVVFGTQSKKKDSSNDSIFTVTYLADNDSVLKVDRVQVGSASIPPVEPEMTYGKVFTKWDKDFSTVESDLVIHPTCDSFAGKDNVFSLPGAYVRTGEYVSVPLSLSGDVLVSGFDLTVSYDTKMLKLDSVYNVDGDVYWNEATPGQIRINFASAKNATADIDICTFKFISLDTIGEVPVKVEVKDVYANNEDESMYKPLYNTISSTVFIYAEGGV